VTELFVPATRPDMIAKAAASAADAVCIDLEDAVAPERKADARAEAVRALASLDFGRRRRVVRINAVDTPFAYRDLVDVVEAAGHRLDAVMLPKAGAARHVEFVDTILGQIEQAFGLATPLAIEVQIESAAGFVNLREIAAASRRVTLLIFGQGDYSASLQMPAASIGERDENDAAYSGHRYHAVMHAIVATARANGLQCLDGPYAAYTDSAGLERACATARVLGFDGKQCIHPGQLKTVSASFAPTAADVARAEAVVQAFDAAVAAGHGAASHDGRMIDAASIRMARALLQRRP
jgi:citrate lyase beta subunit